MLPQANAIILNVHTHSAEDYDAEGADLGIVWQGAADAYFKSDARLVPNPAGGTLDRLSTDTLIIDTDPGVPVVGTYVTFTHEGVQQSRKVTDVATRPAAAGLVGGAKLYLQST